MHQNGLYQTLRIAETHEEVKGFKTIVFEDAHDVSYKAGQYLTLVRFDGAEEIRRSYSITSSPLLKEPLTIGVKRVENGAFSRYLVDDAKSGDEILTIGSGGFFALPDDTHAFQQLFFFAAGSGITPVYSLIKTALHIHPHLHIVLVYSNASEEKAIFLLELQALSQQHASRFSLVTFFSNAVQLSNARLHRDAIFSLLQTFAAQKEHTLFYTCGPDSYMRLCTYTLQEAGVTPANIKRENFYGGNVVKRDFSPPDKNTRLVAIRLKKQTFSIAVHYPDSILRAAKKEGRSLPYSCEAGRCGNCVAKCLKGTVWHSYNEVLTDKELTAGLVLTCTGHPVGSDVVLEIP